MLVHSYRELEITIGRFDGGDAYRISTRDWRGRETIALNRELPEVCKNRLSSRQVGKRLFDFVFSGDLNGVLRINQQEVENEGFGLRLGFRLEDVRELTVLPWEFLFDSQRDKYFSLVNGQSIVRKVRLDISAEPLAPDEPLRILALSSNPNDRCSLATDQEWSLIEESLSDATSEGLVKVRRLESPSLEELRREFRTESPHILHFMGHGNYRQSTGLGSILLKDDAGASLEVSEFHLGLITQGAKLKLAFMNACFTAGSSRTWTFTALAQALLKNGAEAVLGMRDEISDEAAQILTGRFYECLAKGLPLDTSLGEARQSLALIGDQCDTGGECFPEWAVPVLFQRTCYEATLQNSLPNAQSREEDHSQEDRSSPTILHEESSDPVLPGSQIRQGTWAILTSFLVPGMVMLLVGVGVWHSIAKIENLHLEPISGETTTQDSDLDVEGSSSPVVSGEDGSDAQDPQEENGANSTGVSDAAKTIKTPGVPNMEDPASVTLSRTYAIQLTEDPLFQGIDKALFLRMIIKSPAAESNLKGVRNEVLRRLRLYTFKQAKIANSPRGFDAEVVIEFRSEQRGEGRGENLADYICSVDVDVDVGSVPKSLAVSSVLASDPQECPKLLMDVVAERLQSALRSSFGEPRAPEPGR